MVGTYMYIHTYMHAFTHIMYAVSAKLDIRPYKSTDCIRKVCFSPNFPPPKGQREFWIKTSKYYKLLISSDHAANAYNILN